MINPFVSSSVFFCFCNSCTVYIYMFVIRVNYERAFFFNCRFACRFSVDFYIVHV